MSDDLKLLDELDAKLEAFNATKLGTIENLKACNVFLGTVAENAYDILRLARRGLAAGEAMRDIAAEHRSDGHFCVLCGAAGGRYPCATYLTAETALARLAAKEGA